MELLSRRNSPSNRGNRRAVSDGPSSYSVRVRGGRFDFPPEVSPVIPDSFNGFIVAAGDRTVGRLDLRAGHAFSASKPAASELQVTDKILLPLVKSILPRFLLKLRQVPLGNFKRLANVSHRPPMFTQRKTMNQVVAGTRVLIFAGVVILQSEHQATLEIIKTGNTLSKLGYTHGPRLGCRLLWQGSRPHMPQALALCAASFRTCSSLWWEAR